MTDAERANRLAEAQARLEAALAMDLPPAAHALIASAALLVADATPAVQLELFQDAREAA